MRLLSLSLLLALTSACNVAPTSSETSAETTAAPQPVDEALASQVVGTYATQIELHSIQPVPGPLQIFVGKEIASASRLYLLSTISVENGVLQIKEQNCAIRADKVGGATLTVPDSTVQKAGYSISNLDISNVDGAVTIKRGPKTLVLGAKLTNPTTDALPTDAKDPRIVDVEGDRKPGGTGHLSLGLLIKADVYFVQRSTNIYEATLGSDGELSGVIHDKSEQVILGGSGVAAAAASKTPTVFKQNPEKDSTVRFVKIDEGSDCEAASNERLFK